MDRGLATYIKADINSRLAAEQISIADGGESLTVEITGGDNNYIQVINSYLTHDKAGSKITTIEFEMLQGNFILGGDLNADPSGNRTRDRLLKRAFSTCPQVQATNANCGKTNVMNGRETRKIDFILTNADTVSKHQNKKPLYTKQRVDFHKILTAEINFPGFSSKEQFQPRFMWSKWNRELYKALTNARSDTLMKDPSFANMTAQEKHERFTTIANDALKETCPQTTWRTGYWRYAWWNEKCRAAKEEYKNALLNNHDTSTARQKLADILEEEKTAHWSNVFSKVDDLQDTRKSWRTFNRLRNAGKDWPRSRNGSQEECDKIAKKFESRSDPRTLPAHIQRLQEEKKQEREENIAQACEKEDETHDRPLDEELLYAYLRESPKQSAPGRDGISYTMVHTMGITAWKLIYNIIQQSWEEGVLPSQWKHAEIIPIPKKDGEWRPISLLLIISKLAEKLVRARLMEARSEPHVNLFGFETARGVDDATAFMRHLTAQVGNKSKKLKIALFIDFEKAFELISKEAILDILATEGIKGKLLRWLNDYMTRRTAHVKYRGFTSAEFLLRAGTPQGSILSPPLFNIAMNELLHLLDETDMKSRLAQETLQNISYADDLGLTLTSEIQHMEANAQRLLNTLERSSNNLGLKISIKKTEWMLFSGKRPKFELTIYGKRIARVNEFKYLGVIFDRKGNFAHHAQDRQASTKASMQLLRLAVAYGRGIKTRTAINIAKATVGAKITFGSVAIANTNFEEGGDLIYDRDTDRSKELKEKAPSNYEIHQADGTYNLALLRAMDLPIGTPTELVHIESGSLPIPTQRQLRTLRFGVKCIYSTRQHALDPELRNPTSRYTRHLARQLAKHDVVPINKKPRALHMKNTFAGQLVIPKLYEGKKEDHPTEVLRNSTMQYIDSISDDCTVLYYTDGSVDLKNKRAGAAAVGYFVDGQQRVTFSELQMKTRADTHSTETELMALALALNDATKPGFDACTGNKTTHIIFLTDSASLVRMLKQETNDDLIELTYRVKNVSHRLSCKYRLSVHWIPSHIGVPGNERADQLAKEISEKTEEENPVPPALDPVPHGVALMKIRESIVEKWMDWTRSRLATRENIQRQFYIKVNPDLKPFFHPEELNRAEEQLLTLLRLNTPAICWCQAYNLCHYCKAQWTTTHYLLDCKKSRSIIRKHYSHNYGLPATPSPDDPMAVYVYQEERDQNAADLLNAITKKPEEFMKCAKLVAPATYCKAKCKYGEPRYLRPVLHKKMKMPDQYGGGDG